eukprot:jgi/Botrbrau1/213/Bobra.0022s0193.1
MDLAKAMQCVQQFAGPFWEGWFSKAQRLANSLRFVVLADHIAEALAQRQEEEAAAAAGAPSLLESSYPDDYGLTSQRALGNGSLPPSQDEIPHTTATPFTGGEEPAAPRRRSPESQVTASAPGTGRGEPHKPSSLLDKPPASIFSRAPLSNRSNIKENKGPDEKRLPQESGLAKRKSGNPFSVGPPSKVAKH